MRTAPSYFKNPKRSKKPKPGLKMNTLTLAAKEGSRFFEQLLSKKTTLKTEHANFKQTSLLPTSMSKGARNPSRTFKDFQMDFSEREKIESGGAHEENGPPLVPSSFLKIKAIKKKLKYGHPSPVRSWRFLDLSAENVLRATPVSEMVRTEKFATTKLFYVPKSPLRKETILNNRRAFRQTRDKSLSIFYKYKLRRQTMGDRRVQKFADFGSNSFEKRSFLKDKKSLTTSGLKPTGNHLKKNLKKTKLAVGSRAPIQLFPVGYGPINKQKSTLSSSQTYHPSRHEYEKIVAVRGRAVDGIYKHYRPKGRKKKL